MVASKSIKGMKASFIIRRPLTPGRAPYAHCLGGRTPCRDGLAPAPARGSSRTNFGKGANGMCPRLVKSLIGRRGHLISFALGLVLLASSARVANALVVPQGDSLVSLNMPRFEVDGDVIANASCFPGDTRVCSTCQ